MLSGGGLAATWKLDLAFCTLCHPTPATTLSVSFRRDAKLFLAWKWKILIKPSPRSHSQETNKMMLTAQIHKN